MNTNNLFNHHWKFLKQPLGVTLEEALSKEDQFNEVTLPHDWLIYNSEDLYENSTGWYRKEFHWQDVDKKAFLRFEGVYMDAVVYINGVSIGEWKYGYTTFEFEMTPALIEGDNEIVVQVKHQHPNSRWYSGAGIYRDVWLIVRENDYIVSDGLYITTSRTDDDWSLNIETELSLSQPSNLKHVLMRDGIEVASTQMLAHNQDDRTSCETISINQPMLWTNDEPNLYELQSILMVADKVIEVRSTSIGFKEVRMSPQEGFFLNGKYMKLNGVCEHHDLGCLGSAFNKEAMRYRLKKLKAMGVNAIRTAHNIPASGLMALCDEMGFFVVSEGFDMWQRSKTEYDYARFFDEWIEKDVESWVRRDRNHVSLIMWSIGNEIYDTHADAQGLKITKILADLVKKHDPKENGVVTIGSNFMPWGNAQLCADVVKYAGYNYGEKCYESHHKTYEDWIIYGSETASIVQSRGIYHFPLEASILVEEDCQCSSLGNSITSWGAKSMETCITYDRDQIYSLGQFLWTGFDYIGEPTPYKTKNAYYGQIDTAGFEKDSYYVYQSAWTDYREEPMIHLFPYWDFNVGQMIDVRVCTNAPEMKFFLNDTCIGEKKIDHKRDTEIIGTWKIPYREAVLKAVAYDEHGEVIAQEVRTSFGDPIKLQATVNKTKLSGDGNDLAFIEVCAVDGLGNVVENANNEITISVEGEGVLLGVDNGDSSDFSDYKANRKRLFSGRCMVVVGSLLGSGEVKVVLTSPKLLDTSITLDVCEASLSGEVLTYREAGKPYIRSGQVTRVIEEGSSWMPIRKISLEAKGKNKLVSREDRVFVKADIYPINADKQELIWQITTDTGIETHIAYLEEVDGGCYVKAKGDGRFRVRCLVKNRKSHPDIISQLEFEATGIGAAYKDPYGFIIGGLYDRSVGEIGSGNERGIAIGTETRMVVVYDDVDFGAFGSDKITIPIFAFDSEALTFEVWEGMPKDEGSCLIDELSYDKKTIWDVYQEETYQLSKRIRGVVTLAFVFNRRLHMKGFSFEKVDKAYEKLNTLECDEIYGDYFKKYPWGIGNIGNNVALKYNDMNFSKDNADSTQARKIKIYGRSITQKNSIQIKASTSEGSFSQIIEFEHSDDMIERIFDIQPISGECEIEFVFLPGSNFDFGWFQFL